MYSLDYPLHRFYHKCSAQIIYTTDLITNVQLRLPTPYFITNVQLRLSTPHILSYMHSLYYRLYRCYYKCTAWIIYSTNVMINVQLRLSTQHILSQAYSLDYLLDRYNHKCTAQIINSRDFYLKCTDQIIYSTDLITNVQLRLPTPDFITNVQLRLSTPHILSYMYSLYYRLHRCYHKCTA